MQSAEDKQKPQRKRKQSLKVAELLLEGSHGSKTPSSSTTHSYTPSEDRPSSPSSSSSTGSSSSWTSGSDQDEEEEDEEVGVVRLLAPPQGEEGAGKGEWGSPNSNSSD